MDRSGDLITKFRFNVQTTSLNEQFSIRHMEIGWGWVPFKRKICQTLSVQNKHCSAFLASPIVKQACEKVFASFWFCLFISYIYTHLMRK